MYIDFGEAIGIWRDYEASKFDIKIVSGSTLPVNRWAYLEELKQLMNLGVVDDIAVLSETDIRNKEQIVKRKSVYSQQKSQLESQEEKIKDLSGTIETLERQLVQAGIKNKIMQGNVEVSKKVQDSKASIYKDELETKAMQKHLRNTEQTNAKFKLERTGEKIKDFEKNLELNNQ